MFERSESIGLVSSYYLKGDKVWGSGFPFETSILPGVEMARLYLRTSLFVFGSPTAVMYRSSTVRAGRPFFDESRLHEDTEKCFQILEHTDFGFVHQVLSFLRVGNEAISSRVRMFQPNALDRYILVRRYAPVFLDGLEAAAARAEARRTYYGILAEEAIRLPPPAFWRYHEAGLTTLGEALDRRYLALRVAERLFGMAMNPGTTVARAFRLVTRRMRRRTRRGAERGDGL